MEIKKSVFYAMIAFVVIALFGMVAAFSSGPASANGNVNSLNTNVAVANGVSGNSNGEVQNVKLSYENYEYKLSPSTLKQGVPVRMEVDLNTVTGCMRSVVINSFGVRQTVREGDNIIEFTPDKSGTFNIVCSMNMGRGTFNVAQDSGKIAEYKEAAPIADAGSCGGSAGGCGGGCGG